MRRLDAFDHEVAGGPRSLRVVLGDTDPVVRAGLRALVIERVESSHTQPMVGPRDISHIGRSATPFR